MKQQQEFNISRQIVIFFLSIVGIFTIIYLVILFFSNRNEAILNQTYKRGNEFFEDFSGLKEMVKDQNSDLSQVVFFASSKEAQSRLNRRYRFDWPTLKNRLTNLIEKEEYEDLKPKILDLVSEVDTLFEIQKIQFWEPLQNLSVDENEFEFTKIRLAYEFYMVSRYEALTEKLDKINATLKEEYYTAFNELFLSSKKQQTIVIIGFILVGILSIVSVNYLQTSINKPLNQIVQLIYSITQGKLPSTGYKLFQKNSELSKISDKMFDYVDRLKSTVEFTKAVGEGDYSYEFKSMGPEDKLGNTLLDMREKLKVLAEREEIRKWTTKNLRKFDEVLRLKDNDINLLSQELIKLFVQSTNGQLGNFFIKEEEVDTRLNVMALKACYAFDRSKDREMLRYEGDGLLGQVWKDNEVVCIDDLPPNYLEIESGIGNAKPISILIVPLSFSNTVYGIVEIASFENFKDYIIDFAKRAATIIGSTLSNVINTQTNNKLVAEYKTMEVSLLRAERNNKKQAHLLKATEQEIERLRAEMQELENTLAEIFARATYDAEGSLVTINLSFELMLGYDIEEVMGKHHSRMMDKEYRNSQEYIEFWSKLKNGVVLGVIENWSTKDQTRLPMHAYYYPRLNEDNSLKQVEVFLRHLSAEEEKTADLVI